MSVRLPALIFASLTLLALSWLGHSSIREFRAEAEAVIVPALGALVRPLEPVRRLSRHARANLDSFAELERLRDENQLLRHWQSRALDLERRIGELSRLAQVLGEQSIEYRTIRVIATSSGTFVQSALLEGGSEQSVKTGQPVMNADGVLGRIVEAGRRTSRVLLLTDINSRIPVLVGASQVRAILAGDNSRTPRLSFLPPDTSVAVGDEITTSGLGGLFPRGLHIGTVRLSADGPRADLAAELGQQSYASVLLYDNPGLALALELRQVQPEVLPRRRASTERSIRP